MSTHGSHIFTYGSLMFPQVWRRVVSGNYRSSSARLDGYARFEIDNETYPGVIPQPGASVEGVLYFDVSPEDIAALDAFEGADYRRDTVQVTLGSSEIVVAGTYIYLRPEKLSESPWIPEAFQLERFLDTWCPDKLGE